MVIRLIQFFVFLFFVSKALADGTYGYYFGGGGEPANKEMTDFYDDLRRFSVVSKKKNWTSQYIHNGGHRDDDAWIKKYTSGKPKRFSVSEFNNTIVELKGKIGNEIKSGDQLLIVIDTHGEKNEKGKRGHKVKTIDGSVNVSSLKELRNLAEHYDVKLAILDASCHSGPTLKLSTNETCVISMAADDVAYGGDVLRILEAMNTEKNLEEAFLKARLDGLNGIPHGQPQISTAIGVQVGKITGGLSEDLFDKFDADRKEATEWVPCKNRSSDLSDISQLLDKINSDQKLMSDKEIQEYRNEIKNYRDQENAVIDRFNKFKSLDRNVCYSLSTGFKGCLNISGIEAAESFHKEKIKMNDDIDSKMILAELEKIKGGSQFKEYETEKGKLKILGKDIFQRSSSIARLERVLYSKKYSEISKRNGKSNPCREFKL